MLRNSIHPFSTFGSENGQFVVHELRFADCAPHPDAGRVVPIFAHLFPGMTTPAFNERSPGEGAAVDLLQIVLVHPGFGGAVDHVAIIEHETGFVRMPEVFETGDL